VVADGKKIGLNVGQRQIQAGNPLDYQREQYGLYDSHRETTHRSYSDCPPIALSERHVLPLNELECVQTPLHPGHKLRR